MTRLHQPGVEHRSRPGTRGEARWARLVLLLCTLAPLCVAAAPIVANKYELQAAYLFKLAKFTQWPPQKFAREDSPLVVSVLGDEALEWFTRALADKTIGKRKVLVQPFEQTNSLPGCHILFVSHSASQRAAELAEAGRAAGVLTVGETDQFLEHGGMLNFYVESDQLRLEIDDQRVHGAGLSISSAALSTLVNMGTAKIRNL